MVEFVETSLEDLIQSTQFLHDVKPSLRRKLVYALERPKPFDRSVVYHLIDIDDTSKTETCLLSAEYILEHPIWRNKWK